MVSNFNDLMKYQNKVQTLIKKEQTEDDTLEVMTIINEVAPYPGQMIQKEKIFLEAGMRGIDHKSVEKIIERLKIDRVIFEPQFGYLQKK